jgi:hypothetical protein
MFGSRAFGHVEYDGRMDFQVRPHKNNDDGLGSPSYVRQSLSGCELRK